jgi:hypothetical protein
MWPATWVSLDVVHWGWPSLLTLFLSLRGGAALLALALPDTDCPEKNRQDIWLRRTFRLLYLNLVVLNLWLCLNLANWACSGSDFDHLKLTVVLITQCWFLQKDGISRWWAHFVPKAWFVLTALQLVFLGPASTSSPHPLNWAYSQDPLLSLTLTLTSVGFLAAYLLGYYTDVWASLPAFVLLQLSLAGTGSVPIAAFLLIGSTLFAAAIPCWIHTQDPGNWWVPKTRFAHSPWSPSSSKACSALEAGVVQERKFWNLASLAMRFVGAAYLTVILLCGTPRDWCLWLAPLLCCALGLRQQMISFEASVMAEFRDVR